MLSPDEWLKRVGFVDGNPFGLKWADDERDRLPEYFVEHAAYYAVLDAGVPRSSIIHAPRGAGKSSTRQMFEAAQEPRDGEASALILQLLDWMPILERAGAASAVRASDLLRELLQIFIATVSADLPHRADVRPLSPDQLGYLSWIIQRCGGYVAPQQRQALSRERWCDPGPADDYNLERLPTLRGFEILTDLVLTLGYSSCYVVIDGVDELFATVADWEAGAALLAPLLGNVRLLEIPGLAFKCFIPSEIVAVLRDRRILREDRVACIELTWSADLLLSMLRSRLRVFSGGLIGSLAMIATADLGDIDQQICQAALGSPRQLLYLGDRLIHACAQRADDANLLLQSAYLVAAGIGPAPAAATPANPGVPPLLRLLPDGMVWLGDAPIEKSRGFSALQRRLVSYLYTHAGQRCEHDDLISYIWHGRPTPSDSDSLRKLVERTARTLEPDPSNWVYLESQKGAYCLKHTAPAN